MLNKAATHFLTLSFLALLGAGIYSLGDVNLHGTNTPEEVYDQVYAAVMSWQTGDLLGVLIFVFLAGAAFTLAMVAQATRDSDSSASFQEENPVGGATHWPLLTAVGAAIMVMGFVSDSLMAYLGILIVGIGVLELVVLSVTDRAGGTVSENKAARDKLLNPLEIPVFVVALIGAAIVLLSRVLLAVDQDVAVVIAIVVASIVLGIGFLIYGTGNYSRHFIGALVAVAVVGILVAGLFSVAAGEREVERDIGAGVSQQEGLGVN
ncbi:MAG: hypothetical protein ACC652_13780, partial [Acidimicrobiales bacterium]